MSYYWWSIQADYPWQVRIWTSSVPYHTTVGVKICAVKMRFTNLLQMLGGGGGGKKLKKKKEKIKKLELLKMGDEG